MKNFMENTLRWEKICKNFTGYTPPHIGSPNDASRGNEGKGWVVYVTGKKRNLIEMHPRCQMFWHGVSPSQQTGKILGLLYGGPCYLSCFANNFATGARDFSKFQWGGRNFLKIHCR